MAPMLDGTPRGHENRAQEKGPIGPSTDSSIYALEADLAYFHARMEWIGKKPVTRNQKAQLHTFRVLISHVVKVVNHLKLKDSSQS